MKLQFTFAMLICLLMAQLALASEESWNRHEGPYAELNLGTGLAYFGVITPETDVSDSGIDGFSWVGALGYNFTPHHAAEGGFGQWYTAFENDDESVADKEESTHLNVGYLAWRGTIPIKDRFAVFGKLGGMLMSIPDTDEEAWMIAPFTGIGLSYAVTPQLELSVQYQGAVYVVAGAGAVTAGLTYHF